MSLFRNRSLLTLAFAHFVVDFYSGMVPLLVAAQTTPLNLNQRQVGLIALAYGLATSLAQPLIGLLADGVRAPLLALSGVLWEALFIGASGFTRRFDVFLLLVTVAGFGSATFHPPGAGGVPRVSPDRQRGGAMSVFLLGGSSGYAFGPWVAGFVFNAVGPRGTLWLALGTLAVSPLLIVSLSRLRYEPRETQPAARSTEQQPRARIGTPLLPSVGLLALLLWFRAWTSAGLSTYLPQLYLQQGFDLVYAGNVSFALMIATALGSLTAGFLSDRIGRLKVIVASLAMSAPLLYLLLHAGGAQVYVFAALLGFCLNASLPLTLMIGQDMLPGRPGAMTGLTLGFTFVAGGIGAALTGSFAEHVGLPTALAWLVMMPLLSTLAAAGLAGVGRRTRVQPV